MMYSAYMLNKQGNSIQTWRTPFPVLNQSIVPCLVLTVASWPTYRFLRRQVRWSGIPISLRIFQFAMIHTVKSFSVVNEAEGDVFLEFSCFFYDPVDVNLTIKSQSGHGPIPRNLHPFPEIMGVILPLMSLGNYPSHKNQPCHTLRLSHLLRWPALCLWSVFLSK